jgi:hypothetical protein
VCFTFITFSHTDVRSINTPLIFLLPFVMLLDFTLLLDVHPSVPLTRQQVLLSNGRLRENKQGEQ